VQFFKGWLNEACPGCFSRHCLNGPFDIKHLTIEACFHSVERNGIENYFHMFAVLIKVVPFFIFTTKIFYFYGR
jgi:hypothetical protein